MKEDSSQRMKFYCNECGNEMFYDKAEDEWGCTLASDIDWDVAEMIYFERNDEFYYIEPQPWIGRRVEVFDINPDRLSRLLRLGEGTIVDINGDEVTIELDTGETITDCIMWSPADNSRNPIENNI